MRILTTLGLFKGERKVRGSEASLVNSGVIAEFAAAAAVAAHSSTHLGVTERHKLRHDATAPPTCLQMLYCEGIYVSDHAEIKIPTE